MPLLTLLLSAHSCSAVYADTGNKAAGGAVIAMIVSPPFPPPPLPPSPPLTPLPPQFAFYGVAGFAWPGLTVSYCAEILPFHIRAKGLAVTMAGTAASSVFNQYVNPIGLAALHWKFYFVYIAILVLECAAIYFLYVETRGPTLEEIARLFDGEDADVAGKEEVVDVARGKIAGAKGGNDAVGAEHVEEA